MKKNLSKLILLIKSFFWFLYFDLRLFVVGLNKNIPFNFFCILVLLCLPYIILFWPPWKSPLFLFIQDWLKAKFIKPTWYELAGDYLGVIGIDIDKIAIIVNFFIKKTKFIYIEKQITPTDEFLYKYLVGNGSVFWIGFICLTLILYFKIEIDIKNRTITMNNKQLTYYQLASIIFFLIIWWICFFFS